MRRLHVFLALFHGRYIECAQVGDEPWFVRREVNLESICLQ